MNDLGRAMVDALDNAGRLAFEQMLVELLASYAAVRPEAVIDEIEKSLARLTAFLGFDRAAYADIRADGALEILCATAVDGIEALDRGEFPLELPWWRGELEAGRVVAKENLPFDLPPEAVAETAYVTAVGMKAHLGLPLTVGGRTVAMVGFDAYHAPRQWPHDLIVRLKLVGEVFAQALARSRAELKLASALSEIRRLQERLEAENACLRQAAWPGVPPTLASRSPVFNLVLEEAQQVAATSSTVLLLGETGTGKEVLASLIHHKSPRRQRALVKVNCAALPAPLIEAELFGREKGAYTGALARQMGRFEIADGSTIFLDEIGDLPLELQTKLLRVLQSGEFERVGSTQTIRVDVRVIAATNRDLAAAVQAVLAQRLVRVLCPHCAVPTELDDVELKSLGLERSHLSSGAKPMRAVGCPACDHSGYRGRLGIFEMMQLDESLRERIFHGEPTVRLREHALQSGGMSTLLQDGAKKVLAGKTSVQELLRVTAAQ